MGDFVIGCAVNRPPSPGFFDRVVFAELDLTGSVPKASSAAAWRRSAPKEARIALRLPWPRPVGGTDTWPGSSDKSIRRYAALTEAFGAEVAVMTSPAQLTTGARHRRQILEALESLRTATARPVVWAPAGLWDPAATNALAARANVAAEIDPFERHKAPSGDLAYIGVRAVGARRRLGIERLDQVASHLSRSNAKLNYVVLQSQNGIAAVATLRDLLAEQLEALRALEPQHAETNG